MGLDTFGYPAVALANKVLTELDNFGDSTEELEESWFDWLQHNPFDTVVAGRLERLLLEKMDSLDPASDAAAIERIERKLDLVQKRLQRYQPQKFES